MQTGNILLLLEDEAYASGLRVSEFVHLRVTDIDSTRMTIRVEQGKGAQDRYTLLSVRLLDESSTRPYRTLVRSLSLVASARRRTIPPVPARIPRRVADEFRFV